MKVSERGQITIPKALRDQFGMNQDVEVEITATEDGILIRKRTSATDPFERVRGILGGKLCGFDSVDEYIDAIRGR